METTHRAIDELLLDVPQVAGRGSMGPAVADDGFDEPGIEPATVPGTPLRGVFVGSFSPRYLRDHGVLPLTGPKGAITLAVTLPEDAEAIGLVCATLGFSPDAVPRLPVTAEEIEAALPEAGSGHAGDVQEDGSSPVAGDGGRGDDDIEQLRDLASNAPVVRLLNDVFEAAVQAKATDIHCEPSQQGMRVRIRVDGLLRNLRLLQPDLARPLVSRVKILAGLDIAERRLPQDGRMRHVVDGHDFDVRVATMPTVNGETAILRLLDQRRRLIGLDGLGLDPAGVATIAAHLAAPHGLVIVTGPTGSGKTTTLASALATLDRATRKVLTVEDPVEYEIDGVAQTQVRPQIGLTFASALRAFLRQDPDVIMVGEMRDGETARIGIQASLTGHLVMTTLHTNTAAAAIPRLTDLGVEPYLVAASLRCIVGQRLVRALCPHCKVARQLTPRYLAEDARPMAIGLEPGETIFEPVGCSRCGGSGYAGRIGVFEILTATDAIRSLIIAGAPEQDVEEAARREGMATMVEDGVRKIRDGLTSVDEVLRVTAIR